MASSAKEDDNEEIWKERCYDCIRCSVKEDCKLCSACSTNKTCEQRRCFAAKKLYNEKVRRLANENMKQIMAKTAAREAETAAPPRPVDVPERKKRGRRKGSVNVASKKISERDYAAARPTRQHSADLRRKRAQLNAVPDKQPRHCLNPDCIHEARMDSKYCSDECGRVLARMRLIEVLPARCQEYFSGPHSRVQQFQRKQESLDREMLTLTNSEKSMIQFLEKLHEFVEKLAICTPEMIEERDDDVM
uniref:CXXC-type zinc finger protein 1 n=1 Tax=Caenorhabditis japonica TaxID=281687 RepID=A0A8R1DXM7_CAEJA